MTTQQNSGGACVPLQPMVRRKIPVCGGCGTPVRDGDKFCLKCCGEQTPLGEPLKRCRKYGFKVTYRQRQQMNLIKEVSGSIPIDVDKSRNAVMMAHLYVACNGKTYIGKEVVYRCGSSYGWSEPYPPNDLNEPRGK